ncbi:MAG: hypothetical protein H7061_05955, partial [Bdellovibrionaceae bacterium]|nr:hypothetical protein [Bdellovibrio sp.]
IFVGNASNIAQGMVLSGDATINNAGILAFNTVATAGTFPKVTFNVKGLVTSGSTLSSTDVTTGLGYTPATTALASGNIFVGNASNLSTAISMSGDGTINNAGTFTLSSVATAGTSPRITFDAKGRVTSGSALTSSDVTTGLGTQAANTVLAGPVSGGATTAGFRSLASSDISGFGFVNGGNSFGATASIGTNDAQLVTVKTNGTTRLTVDTTGGVQISGQAWSAVQTSTTDVSITFDTNLGNIMRWSPTTPTSVAIHNMKPGGAYMLVVNAAGTSTVGITCFSGAGTGSLPIGFMPANGNRVVGPLTKTVYTLMSDGQNCLITWITGY